MGMGCTRMAERVCAAVGLLSEAPSQFVNAESVAQGGVLWALPALLANGLLRHARTCFQLPKGFYSLIHVFLLLGYMALARIKTIEQLQYHPAGEWGKLLGLDRIPEVRTLRGNMMQNFAIDRLVDYQTGVADETAKVVNPAYRKLGSEIKSKAAKLSRTLAQFGAIVLPVELETRQVAAYEREKRRLKEEIDFLQADLTKQKAQRKETPKHVRLADLPEQERFVPLSPTRKQFLDTIKMIAGLSPYYANS